MAKANHSMYGRSRSSENPALSWPVLHTYLAVLLFLSYTYLTWTSMHRVPVSSRLESTDMFMYFCHIKILLVWNYFHRCERIDYFPVADFLHAKPPSSLHVRHHVFVDLMAK